MKHPLIEPLESRIAPASVLSINPSVSLAEGNSGTKAFTFTVSLTEAPTTTVEVNFATADGTATVAGADYSARSDKLTFQPGGALSQTVSVSVNGDTTGEDDEAFTLNLSNLTGDATLGNATGTGTILNDAVLTLSKSGDVTEGDTDTQDITFTVMLAEGPLTTDVVANAVIVDVTTLTGQDYVSLPATALTFAPGTTSRTLVVQVKGDTLQELNESFDLQLTPVGTGASVANNLLRATIFTDLLTVAQSPGTVTEGASGQSLVSYVVDLGDYEGVFPVTVSYATDNGTASSGSDFASTSGTLTFADATPQTVTVAIYGDLTAETSETFTFRAQFASPGGSVPTFVRNTTTTIVNDDLTFSIADNLATTSATQGLAELNAGTQFMTFAVTMTGAITAPVTVRYQTVDGPSGARGATVLDGDYVGVSNGTLTFLPGGSGTQNISVTINGDTKAEVSERFTVDLTSVEAPGFSTQITDASGLGIIKNDDASVSLSSLGSVAEGQSGTRTVGFRATISAALPDAVTFTYSTADGAVTPLTVPAGAATAAVSNNDYVPVTNGTVTIARNATFADFFITVRGDTLIETDEVFTVTLPGNVADTIIGTASALGTILNDDPSVSIGDVTVTEGTGGPATATFVVTLSSAPTAGESVTVKFATVAGTAAATADFVPRTDETLTFATGETQKTITINVEGDNRFEAASETFGVTLSDAKLIKSSGETALAIARPTGTATILDDDTPTVSIVPAVRLAENGGAAVFTVSLSNASDLPISVQYQTQNGTATVANGDYVALGLSTLTFPAGVTSDSVSVSITNDAVNELDETFQVLLSNAKIVGGAALTIGNATGIGTIANDERTVSIGNATLLEDAAAMNFTVTLSQQSPNPVTVFYSTRDGGVNPATAGADYTAISGSIVIPANTSTGTIAIPIREDATDEVDQTFEVVISNPTNAILAGNGVGTGTITDDDDAPTVQIVPTLNVNEGTASDGSATFTVSLSAASEKVVTVNYATAAGTATVGTDFITTAALLTFPVGTTSRTFSVVVKADGITEPDETFTATLSAPVNATLGTTITSTATIVNDDLAPTLSIADFTARENAGNFTFNVTLSRAVSEQVTVQFTTVDSTALVGSDYTLNAGMLTFAANETSKTITVSVLNNDGPAELNENFLVRLSSPTGATLLDAEATGLIQNDDVAFSVADLTVAETGTALVTVTRTGTAAAAVQFRTLDGTALSTSGRDFTATNGTLSFAAGEITKTIAIPIAADAAYEFSEQFAIELFAPVHSVILDGAATVTITDNDTVPTLSVASASAIEGNTASQLVFTVQLSAPNEREDITVQFETLAGTAVSTGTPVDFNPPANGVGEVRFAKGQSSRPLPITLVNDSRDEADETFTLRLKNANAAFTAGGATLDATGTIVDDDATPTVTLLSGLTIGENESGLASKIFTAQLSSASERPVTVNWRTDASTTGTRATGGADFTAVSATTLTFAPGVTEQTFTVVVIDDLLDEVDEVFDVVLENPNSNVTLGATTRVTATITDNDAAPALSIGDVSIVEGAAPALVFTVSLSAPSGRELTVNYSTGATGDTATASGPFADYTAVTGATLTFLPVRPDPDNVGQTLPAETTKTITIPIIDDPFREEVAVTAGNSFELAGEKFTVTLATPVNATLADATAEGLIQNGTDATLGLIVANSVVAESNLTSTGAPAQSKLVFQVALSSPAVEPVSFSVNSRNGTALAGVDYAAISNTVSIGGTTTTTETIEGVPTEVTRPGGTTASFEVNTIGDTLFEASETLFVDLTGFTGGATPLDLDSTGRVVKRGLILNDDVNLLDNGRTLQWIDVDGDLVTMTTTRGSFAAVPGAQFQPTDADGNLQFNTDGTAVLVPWLQPAGTLGGRQLVLLSLINLGGFAGASISITADYQPGFGGTSDGVVHIGEIRAGQRIGGELDWFGVDLNSVTVEGDLAKITAGDNISTTALRRLEVDSLGRFATAPNGGVGSEILGPVGTVLVHGDLRGQLKLIGQEFGRIGTLTIEGALRGGTLANTGQVLVSGRVATATIGEIVGGAGTNSGALLGNQNNGGALGNVTVLGAVTGGSGQLSGIIQGAQVGHVKLGALTGGGGQNSGLVFAIAGNVASLTVEGAITGGTGTASGQVFAAGAIGHVKVATITGGTGTASALIRANAGGIASVTLTGALTGGAGDNSGQIFAQTSIGHVKIGSLVGGAGEAAGTIGITDTGSTDTNGNTIFGSTGSVASVTIADSITGGGGDFSGVAAAFSSLGPVRIGGDVLGGGGDASGQVFSQGSLGRVTIGDDVLGGAGAESGVVKGARISDVSIAGDLIGGAGTESGSVEAGRISTLTIGGVVGGGAGQDSGSVRITDDATKITVGENTAGQSVIGGTGLRAGRIAVTDDLRQIILAGDIVGGAGNFSGGLVVGGDLTTATLRGSIVGGNAPASGAALQNSGFLQANVLHSAVLSGNLTTGTDAGAGLTNSGVIRTNRIESLVIEGNVAGNATVPAVISASAAGDLSDVGIRSLLIKGNVTFAEILAGYGGDTAASFRGQFTSADAQIGKVEIRGNTGGVNIIAGAAPGAEGRFGDATDVLASGAGVRNSDRVLSSIASVILSGQQAQNPASYGIVAQHVVSVRNGATPLAGLTRGPGNDLGATDPADLIVVNFRAVELPV